MIRDQIERFERRCNEIRKSHSTGSVTLLVKYASGSVASSSVTKSNAPVSARIEIEEKPIGQILQSHWESLRREEDCFFGEIKVTKSYLHGRLMSLNESSTIQCK